MATYSIEHGYQKSRRMPGFFVTFRLITILGIIGGGLWYYFLPPKADNVNYAEALTTKEEKIQTITAPLPWPAYGQSAYGTAGGRVIATSAQDNKPVPIASLAKVITALAVLKQKPLKPGEEGPMITLRERDVALYGEYLRKNGTVVPVEAGEQISQYQALQAMLMPSANNIADSLVIWAFGSLEAYTEYANKMVTDMGLNNTNVDDASGFSPSTVSTPQDMVVLGMAYMKHPVLTDIASSPKANLPVAGTLVNYNSPINQNGLLGIKVGYTDEAGRCFMLANVRTDGSKELVSLSVVLGADRLDIAMKDAKKLIHAGDASFDKAAIR